MWMYVSDVDEESNERRGRDDVVSIVRVLWAVDVCCGFVCTTSAQHLDTETSLYTSWGSVNVSCVCVYVKIMDQVETEGIQLYPLPDCDDDEDDDYKQQCHQLKVCLYLY